MDDELGHVVGRGRFSGKDDHTRQHIGLRIAQDALVARNHMQYIQKLTLVFVDALDLHIKHGVYRQLQPQVGLHPVCQPLLVGAFDILQRFDQSRLMRQRCQTTELGQVTPPAGANIFVKHPRQCRIGLCQPAARRDAVSFIVEARWPQLRKFGKYRLLHQRRMQGRNPVDRVARHHRQIGHTHPALALFVHQRDAL